ncbi:alpha/beta-hydrolase [Sporormia fimetaria CBS 119925]|uniref:Alpha/beta-hydrolase n=1 Tax=Sporormia fimetaria CBS 119925 TaxID=1340428 RepID=A0A6A6VNE7_9PLEO|nr:alpha/beta-hydrolase [Sporormia fimetaria CBS 119925]
MSRLPTLVFIHGSWHQPNCYREIIKPLQETHGFRCIAVSLPSTSGDPNASFKDDIDAARTPITHETAQGRNVVVIAHSYGGMVGNSAIKGLTRPKSHNNPNLANDPDFQTSSMPSSTAASISGSTTTSLRTSQIKQSPNPGSVIGLILIASGFTLTGLAFMDPFFGHPPPSWRANRETGFADLIVPPADLFYHDLPPSERDYWVSQLRTQSLKALFEGGEFAYAGWLDVPVWYVGTIQDRGLPVIAQRVNVGMGRAMGASVCHVELESSHSPFLSRVRDVVAIVDQAVKAFMGEREKGDRLELLRSRGCGIVIPAVKSWSPGTWFRYGIPLFMGALVGRGISLFYWCRAFWRQAGRSGSSRGTQTTVQASEKTM